MSPKDDSSTYSRDFRRIADALERLAEHFAPTEPLRERRPATLTSAKYRREGDSPEAWSEVEAQAKSPRIVNAQIRREP